ncbi:hypothetical protein NL391_27840, partial [Klebsiella pneumoniae]|nr:hypothetical protein [Klebsiella pneumoniae]
MNNISLQSALSFLSSTCKYDQSEFNQELQEAVLEYIATEAETVLAMPEFDTLSREVAVLIFFQENLQTTEEIKFGA